MLSSFIHEELIRLRVPANTWQNAVRESGRVLLDAGYILPGYIEAMVDSITEVGPYVVVAPHIAIPHARPECGALREGVSVVTLENPVYFGSEANDPVKYVFCLSAANSSSHLDLMQGLVEILERKEFYEALDRASSAEDVLQFIRQFPGKGGE